MNKGFAKMTEREKIIKVIDEWANKAVKANKFDGASVYNPHNAAELADALIAAGIGDKNLMDKKLILNALRTLYLMALELKSVVNSLEKAIDLKNIKK